jgi:hypothetical protein
VAPFHRLPRGFRLRMLDPGFISRDILLHEALISCIVSVQKTSGNYFPSLHCESVIIMHPASTDLAIANPGLQIYACNSVIRNSLAVSCSSANFVLQFSGKLRPRVRHLFSFNAHYKSVFSKT